ncbi:MAG: PAS domain-containing protein [Alphaproteobacteria bacterium]|nr:PAS domain-containing protein [Alphaproteobacteria bacterium]
MLKQSNSLVIFIVLAAVVGFIILSSNSAALAIVAALGVVFAGLIGTKLGKEKAAEQDGDAAETQAGEQATQHNAAASASAGHTSEAAQSTATGQANSAVPGSAVKTATRPNIASDTGTPSQVDLLKNLVASVSEGITFKDPQGRYLSANAAFAQMLGSRPSEIVGRDDAGVFGLLTAKSLLASDDAAAQKGQVSTTLEVTLPSGPRFFEITKSSVNNDDDSLEGIVAVWRDVTDQALYRIRREKAMSETIMAFTKSIELRDSYLGDHAQRLAHLAAAVTDVMELDDDVSTTVELAAYLSQIGKLGVDPNLLGQQRRFTEQEIKEVQKHVHHTASLLRDRDFGLPVAATLFQIHERLDGTGYPQGLKDGDVALPARILGACDVFCARVAPRSYRPAITPEAAIDILQQNPHRYDETVVRAMQKVMQSPEGAAILQQQ